MSDYSETMSDGVLVDGSAFSSVTIADDTSIFWNVNGSFVLDTTIEYNVGQLPLRWYRVEGVCEKVTCTVGIGDDTNCSSKFFFVQNILANSVKDVCKKLTNENLSWQLSKIQEFSQPLIPVPASGECNTLTTVPFCQIPECVNFCVQTNAITRIKAKTVVYDTFLNYVGSGQANFFGTAITTGATSNTSNYEYVSNGGPVLTGGSATTGSSWEFDLLTQITATTQVQDIQANFGSSGAFSLTQPTQTVTTACGTCTLMPRTIYMFHNLQNGAIFSDFLLRNGFNISSPLTLHYNDRLQSWIGNFHLTGIGSDNFSSQESWRFSVQWSCLTDIYNENISPAYKFSLLIVRKNDDTGQEYDTRYFVIFPPDPVCSSIQNLNFDFIFSFNLTNKSVSNNFNITATDFLLTDNISFFKSAFWAKNPNLSIKFSKKTTALTTQTVITEPYVL